jgi:hypothetical protein
VPLLWQILLIPLALVVWALTFEGNIWCIYGYVTFREGRFTRLSFKLLRSLALILLIVSLVAPWAALFVWGLWAANLTGIWFCLSAFLFIYFAGRLMERRADWFYDTERDRRALRDVADREEAKFLRTIEEWPRLSPREKRRFVESYVSYPLHMREGFFIRLLDTFPTVNSVEDLPSALPRLPTSKLMHWAGALLFNHIESILEIRHGLKDSGLFVGRVPRAPRNDEHPEAQGEILLARTGEDEFAIGPRP